MGTKGREMATNDQGGHCHDSYLLAVQFFLKKHPDALNFTHQMGWIQFYVLALNVLM